MKTLTRQALILCILILGCAPLSSSPAAHRPVIVAAPESDSAHCQRPDAPNLKRLANGHYRVRKPWTVMLNGRSWRVPAGYTTNGITGPSWLKNTLGNGVNYPETWAAMFHDWLFKNTALSRGQADRLFQDLLLAYGVNSEKAWIMGTAVSAYSLSKAL